MEDGQQIRMSIVYSEKTDFAKTVISGPAVASNAPAIKLQIGHRYITRGGWLCDVIYKKHTVIKVGNGLEQQALHSWLVIHSEDSSFVNHTPLVMHSDNGRALHPVGCQIGNFLPTGDKLFDHPADIVAEATANAKTATSGVASSASSASRGGDHDSDKASTRID